MSWVEMEQHEMGSRICGSYLQESKNPFLVFSGRDSGAIKMKIGKLCSAFAYLQENAFTLLHLSNFYRGFVHDLCFLFLLLLHWLR